MASSTGSPYRRDRRFSLIEVMVVLLILGLLSAIAVPRVADRLDKVRWQQSRIQAKAVANLVKDYHLDLSEYPARLGHLVVNPGSDNWDGPYVESGELPLDGWDREFGYVVPGEGGRPFDIIGYGKDGVPGGTGRWDRDVSNWD